MRVVAFINDDLVVRQILEHLGLWPANVRPDPRAHSPPAALYKHDPDCQLPAFEDHLCPLPPAEWES